MKSPLRSILAALLLLLLPAYGWADYLILSRSAQLKSEPRTDSDTLVKLNSSAQVELLEPKQQNGYYHVQDPDSGQSGWIYRTLGRRYSDAETAVSTPTSPEFAARKTAAKKRASGPCVSDLAHCPVSGCEPPDSDHGRLNKQKRNRPPTGSAVTLTFDDFRTLQKKFNALHLPVGPGTELSADDRSRLAQGFDLGHGVKVGEGRLVQLVGYISPDRDLRASGGESVNCRLPGAESNDIHVPMVEQPEGSEYESIVVEPIPQDRPNAWSLAMFKKAQADGVLLMIRGQLLMDNQHLVHTDPDDGLDRQPKRFTLWEIHPITQIFQCTRADNKCVASDMSTWAEIK